MKAVSVALSAGALSYVVLQSISAAGAAQFNEAVLHSFGNGSDGQAPAATIINVNGTLYGTTYGGGAYSGGTLFSYDMSTGIYTLLYSFGSSTDGQYPYASLIDVNGTLYGTTGNGGSFGNGTVFSFDPNTGTEKVLYSFCEQQNCADGQLPYNNLIALNGTLYGTTREGGTFGYGTAYAFDPSTGKETVLHSFGNGADGQHPECNLTDVKGTLFGTTRDGGAYGYGTVFTLHRKNGKEKVVYSLNGDTDGQNPEDGLIVAKGTLYGAARYGGANGGGTVFALDPTTGVLSVLHTFCSEQNCTDGSQPATRPLYVRGMLYGTTQIGGAYNAGAAYALDLATGKTKAIYSFCAQLNCADGEVPDSALIDVTGTLYGTTYFGGAYSAGTAFALTKP
jgi:uncharacterized repeat protein (TIGR03803 family)